jgi:hypothetical protein
MTAQRLAALAIIAAPLFATPALAAPQRATVPPGSSSSAVQQAPTGFLGMDTAQVLPDSLSYISAGVVAGALNYSRGMGNGAELATGINLALPIGGAFTGGLVAAWKQQLARTGSLSIAVRPGILVGIGGAASSFGAGVGLPFTFDVGAGQLTAEPRVLFPNFANTAGATTGASGDVAIGYQMPVAQRWSLLALADPTFAFGGGTFTLPLGVGTRFSPTATSHVDVTLGNLNTTPTFGGTVGLVNVIGHVGF